MNTAVISVPRSVAIERLAEYKRSLAARRSADDADVARAFREVLRGHTLINLPDTIDRAGVDSNGRPRVAIAQADWEEVFVSQRNGLFLFHPSRWLYSSQQALAGRQVTPARIRVRGSLAEGSRGVATARVPEIPAHLKPTDPRKYHVLWEANWTTAPDPDPMLIRWIGGEVWVVTSAWELTPLEVAILRR